MQTTFQAIKLLTVFMLAASMLHSQIYYRTEQDPATKYALGYEDGKSAGHDVSQVSWALRGFGCAFLTCGFGGCVVWSQTRNSGDAPTEIPLGKDPEYITGYIEGYRAATRSTKQTAAITGCIIGTILDAAIIGVLTSGYARTFKEVWDDIWN
ncbi:hypothetical protein JXB22_07470 [candidate division WOR-3 bacterium]|nr:hypothetical protein [candidate division WOR-3 bacterium]